MTDEEGLSGSEGPETPETEEGVAGAPERGRYADLDRYADSEPRAERARTERGAGSGRRTEGPSRRSSRGGRHGAAPSRRPAPEASRVAGSAGEPRAARVPRLPASSQARMRRLTIALGILVALTGVIAYATWSTLYRADAANIPAGQTVTIVVAKGSSGEQVAAQLARAGVVANATMFRVQAQMLSATDDIKAGTYTFTTGSDYEPVIRMLQQGPPADPTITFTIPEGWGIEKVAARVQDKLGIPADEFVTLASTGAKKFHYAFLAANKTKSLEGYLFPKTYTVKEGATATEVINVMLTQYGKETAPLDFSYAESKGFDPHEALIIASMIEREAAVESERPKVSSVVYNRTEIGMRLQFCSTVQYVLGGKAKAKLTNADLETPSPYNTYIHEGLPPGPICSPGLAAIEAALAPAETRYLYFVLTGKDGSQSFATSYEKFLELKAQANNGLK